MCVCVYLYIHTYILHTNLNIQIEYFTKSILSPFIPEANRSSNFCITNFTSSSNFRKHRCRHVSLSGYWPSTPMWCTTCVESQERDLSSQVYVVQDVQVCIVQVHEWYGNFAAYKCVFIYMYYLNQIRSKSNQKEWCNSS